MSDSEIFVAKTGAVFDHDGERVVLRPGITRVAAGHPILRGREHLFEPLTVHYGLEPDEPEDETASDGSPVEQATARPGEKRTGTKRSGKSKSEQTG